MNYHEVRQLSWRRPYQIKTEVIRRGSDQNMHKHTYLTSVTRSGISEYFISVSRIKAASIETQVQRELAWNKCLFWSCTQNNISWGWKRASGRTTAQIYSLNLTQNWIRKPMSSTWLHSFSRSQPLTPSWPHLRWWGGALPHGAVILCSCS